MLHRVPRKREIQFYILFNPTVTSTIESSCYRQKCHLINGFLYQIAIEIPFMTIRLMVASIKSDRLSVSVWE